MMDFSKEVGGLFDWEDEWERRSERRVEEGEESADEIIEVGEEGRLMSGEEEELEGENMYGLAIISETRGGSQSTAPRVGGTPPRISVKAWRRNAARPRTRMAITADNVVCRVSDVPGGRRT